MDNIYNKTTSTWVRPWMTTKFDNLYDRDERFFSILVKGALGWLTNNIILYNKSIRHFIFNTGSSYMYIESNGYNFSWSETTGEDTIYMHMPRCVVEIGDVNIPLEELTQPFVRGTYERLDNNEMKGYNAEIRRLPIELSLNLKYVLSNFNESIILLQELIDKLVFMKYFSISYLGQRIECSIEFPQNMNIQLNKIDMSSAETNQKNIEIQLKICTNYPIVNEKSETENSAMASIINANIDMVSSNNFITDKTEISVK